MTTTITVGSPEYKTLLHRHNELSSRFHSSDRTIARGVTIAERDEMIRIAYILEGAELAHDQAQQGATG